MIAGVLRQLVWGAGHDCVVIVGVRQTHPVELDGQLQVGQVQKSTIVILGCRPYIYIQVTFEYKLGCKTRNKIRFNNMK